MIEEQTLFQNSWGDLVALAEDLVDISSLKIKTEKDSPPLLCLNVSRQGKTEVELKYNVVEVDNQLLLFFSPEHCQDEALNEKAIDVAKKWNATKSKHQQFTATTKASVKGKLKPMMDSEGQLQTNFGSLSATNLKYDDWTDITTLARRDHSTGSKNDEFVYVSSPINTHKITAESLKVIKRNDKVAENVRPYGSSPITKNNKVPIGDGWVKIAPIKPEAQVREKTVVQQAQNEKQELNPANSDEKSSETDETVDEEYADMDLSQLDLKQEQLLNTATSVTPEGKIEYLTGEACNERDPKRSAVKILFDTKLPLGHRLMKGVKQMLTPPNFIETTRQTDGQAYIYLTKYITGEYGFDAVQSLMPSTPPVKIYDHQVFQFLFNENVRLKKMPIGTKPNLYVIPMGIVRTGGAASFSKSLNLSSGNHSILGVIYKNELWVVDSKKLSDYDGLFSFRTDFQKIFDVSNCVAYTAYTAQRLIEEYLKYGEKHDTFKKIMKRVKKTPPSSEFIASMFDDVTPLDSVK